MTPDELKIYFPFSVDDDLTELYADRLFEYKQFFIQKPPIHKVFEAKLSKLIKMHTAFEIVSGQTFAEQLIQSNDVEISNELLHAFSTFEKQKGDYKLHVYSAGNALFLNQIVLNWLRTVDAYYQKWASFCDFEIVVEAISKEPDPMELLSAIRDFEKSGGKEFQDISKLKNNEVLMKEMKRVSLLHQKMSL